MASGLFGSACLQTIARGVAHWGSRGFTEDVPDVQGLARKMWLTTKYLTLFV